MAQQIEKLSPHRDLQCYFLTPSAIAAMSGSGEAGFTLSGKWRQQFDWAVVEWNRDNTFEHPALRNLPDGDLSGLVLSYVEERTGCIPLESNLVPVVDWNNLRIWAPAADGLSEQVYHVDLAPHAVPVSGSYQAASGVMTLAALPEVGKRTGLGLLEQHYYYIAQENDTVADVAAGIAANINQLSGTFSAQSSGPAIKVSWKLTTPQPAYPDLRGTNGNRVTMFGFVEGGSAVWQSPSVAFSAGQFPTQYKVTIDFGLLKASGIPTDKVRKLRWTWAADLQAGTFVQTEFQVVLSGWTVTGSNRTYSVAGPGSRRIEDCDQTVTYAGSWALRTGNYSGSKIHSTVEAGDQCTLIYSEPAEHQLLLGTRRFATAARVTVSIDGSLLETFDLALAGEDVLVRLPLGNVGPGSHTVVISHEGPAGSELFFDFLEIAYPSTDLPDVAPQTQLGLATDWDTYHSQSLPAERTAWLINQLGFQGRVNHYTGALRFGELIRTGTTYASLTLTFGTQAASSPYVQLNLAAMQGAGTPSTPVAHLVSPDETTANVVEALAGLINNGTNLLWACAAGNQLILTARAMGTLGNGINVQVDAATQGFTVLPLAGILSGGVDGAPYGLDPSDSLNSTLMAAADFWQTDLTAEPRLNRAARDWHAAFFRALKGYGIDVVASFSTELLNVDPSLQAGMAQRYPDGTPVVLNTPAVQTNFSPTALQFWEQVYLDMAGLQSGAGLLPYLQAGEIQWWYFPKQAWNPSTSTNENAGMPFYDAYTQQQFQAKYGVPMQSILSNNADPALYPNEMVFLPSLIGSFTAAIRGALTGAYPGSRFEVLYPTDTNNTPLNSAVNYAESDWTPANLTALKTESFGFTGAYDLDRCAYSIGVSEAKGFANAQRSHVVGISDSWTSWMKEVNMAQAQGLSAIVLFALDQYCLIGYPPPPYGTSARSARQGG